MDTTGDTAATPGQVVGGDGVEDVDHGPGVAGAARHLLRGLQPLENTHNRTCSVKKGIFISASKMSIRRFVITEKAPTRAFSWLKAATTHGISGTGIPNKFTLIRPKNAE